MQLSLDVCMTVMPSLLISNRGLGGLLFVNGFVGIFVIPFCSLGCPKKAKGSAFLMSPQRSSFHRQSSDLGGHLAGVAGFEPAGLRSQSPLPYRLAILQWRGKRESNQHFTNSKSLPLRFPISVIASYYYVIRWKGRLHRLIKLLTHNFALVLN